MKPLAIKIHRNKKNKNIRLNIKSDLVLHLFVPEQYTHCDIDMLLERFQGWISKTIRELFYKQESLKKTLEDHENQILIFGEWKNAIEYTNIKSIHQTLMEYLKIKTKSYADQMGVIYQKLAVRNNKRILGSCNHLDQLSFSSLLCFAHKDLIDYVIVHELAHIKHKNHSKDFWNFVGKFCANHVEKRQEIKHNMGLYNMLYQKYYN